MKYQVTPQQITNELYNIFSDDRRESQYMTAAPVPSPTDPTGTDGQWAKGETTEGTPSEGSTGAAYGDCEKSPIFEKPADGLQLVDIAGGGVTVQDATPEASAPADELPAPPALVSYDPAEPVERAEFHTSDEMEPTAPTDGSHPATEETPTEDPAPSDGVTGAAYGSSEKSQISETSADVLADIIAIHVKAKQKAPDAVVLFRCGSFYKAFFDDAEQVAKVTGVTLGRAKEGNPVAMFPEHCLDTYLPRMIRAGLRVCLADVPEPKAKRPEPMAAPAPAPEVAPMATPSAEPTEEGTECRAHDADGRPYGPSAKSPIRTKETEEINAALRMIPGNVMRDFGFIADGGTIVTNHGTPCLLHPSRGFLVMPEGPGVPYSPCGGSDALQSILDAGGFLNFDGFRFVWPIDHNADSIRRVLEVFGAV